MIKGVCLSLGSAFNDCSFTSSKVWLLLGLSRTAEPTPPNTRLLFEPWMSQTTNRVWAESQFTRQMTVLFFFRVQEHANVIPFTATLIALHYFWFF
jgi:hypothetical protein